MTRSIQSASEASEQPRAEEPAPSAGPFVINLCASTTPMALAHPDAPELKRFSFFVSRRLEDGRERFRLHMGQFATLAEAEEWLNVVRDIYPGAWAGEAPGKRLRARAAATAQIQSPALAAEPPAPVLAAKASRKVPLAVPTVHAAPPVVSAPPTPPPAAVTSPVPSPAPAPVRAPVAAPVAAKKPTPAVPGSNVREVLAALDDTGATRQMPAVAVAPRAAAETPQALSDTQVLKILENRQTKPRAPGGEEANTGIALLRPDDTGTRRALKEAVQRNAPVSFAVQLHWSVQPVALERVPPLAIFSAYTLYTVEGSREGRKWYGLRLGFFTDALAAKQVAHYVRSEFASVAVVPVSPQERSRASHDEGKTSRGWVADQPRAAAAEEIKLIDEAVAAPAPRPVVSPPPAAPAKRNVKPGARTRAHERRGTQSLEETLEILGASELEIDNGRGELLNDSGVRHLRVGLQKNSPFARLLDRLSERLKGK